MLEALPLADGTKVEKADKKESKEEFSIKIFQPASKSFAPLFVAAESEAEMQDWLKDLIKSVDIGKVKEFTHVLMFNVACDSFARLRKVRNEEIHFEYFKKCNHRA